MGPVKKTYLLFVTKVPVLLRHLSKHAECQGVHNSMQRNDCNYSVQSCVPTTTSASASLCLWVLHKQTVNNPI